MKPNVYSPRTRTTAPKTVSQNSADPANATNKRAVTFNEADVERTPVMTSRSPEKMHGTTQLSHASDDSDDAASSIGSDTDAQRGRGLAPRETYRFHARWEMLESASAKDEKSSSASCSTASAPSSLPNTNDRFPRSPKLVVRVPNFSAPASIMPSPIGTPRPEQEREPQRTPRRLASFRRIGRELSRKLESMSMISRSDKSSASSSSGASTPRTVQKIEPVADLTQTCLDSLALKIEALQANEKFKSLPAVSRKIILKAEVLQSLPAESPLRDPESVAHLLDCANKRIAIKNSGMDTHVNLNDPAFSEFVSSAAHGAFIKPWIRDASTVEPALRGYLDAVKPTFARDFENSAYFFRQADGSVNKLTSIDTFLACVKPGKASNAALPMIVSNIASQNLGNFIKNALFLRQDGNGVSQSVLKSRHGAPLMPLAVVKASYILSRDEEGAVIIDYTWLSATEINGEKEMRAREMVGDFKTVPIERASLQINVRVRVEASGEWTVFDPHLRAKGWV